MELNKDNIKKIAELAKLELNDIEILKYQSQLSSVLDYIDILKEVECSDSDILGLESDEFNRTREDLAFSWDKEEKKIALKQANEKDGDFIKVNRVI